MDSGDLLALARRLLDYDPLTGVFTWTQQARPQKRGQRTGTVMRDGSIYLRLQGQGVYAHRLAFALVHGHWPQWVAHKDGDLSNNRIDNLREGDAQQRVWSARKRATETTSRFKGVYWCKRKGKWHARIHVGPSAKHLGFFDVEEAAGAAYARAVAQVAGEFARAN